MLQVGPYVPVFEEPVGRVIVHCGVQIHVFNGNCRHMFFQFMESSKEADRIMRLALVKRRSSGMSVLSLLL